MLSDARIRRKNQTVKTFHKKKEAADFAVSFFDCCHNFFNFLLYGDCRNFKNLSSLYQKSKKERSMQKHPQSVSRMFAVHNMNKSFTEISKEENQDMLLNIKKAYRLANGSMHGFQDWCIDKEINEYFYAEKEIAELEGGYLYSVFRKSFPNWMESNNLKSWKDVEIFIKGESA